MHRVPQLHLHLGDSGLSGLGSCQLPPSPPLFSSFFFFFPKSSLCISEADSRNGWYYRQFSVSRILLFSKLAILFLFPNTFFCFKDPVRACYYPILSYFKLYPFFMAWCKPFLLLVICFYFNKLKAIFLEFQNKTKSYTVFFHYL